MSPSEADIPFLQLASLSKRFGEVQAVAGVDCAVMGGSFVAVVGESGSGKSTLLKMINLLVEPDSGSVEIGGVSVQDMPLTALRRSIGYVFQGIGLFPHMDVAQNIGIGPRLAGSPVGAQRIEELLELVELDGSYAARMPDQLSGGQRQRIGVARALAGNPQILLMDEPFGALDPITRDALGVRVRDLHQRLGLTTLMVTHDMAEALLLADRVIVMRDGQIVADETPHDLLSGEGGDIAQQLVGVPRQQAERLAELRNSGPAG